MGVVVGVVVGMSYYGLINQDLLAMALETCMHRLEQYTVAITCDISLKPQAQTS